MEKRLKIQVSGIVQGVGFRPFVYNLAKEKNLSGFVGNDSNGVFIEAQGNESDIGEFLDVLENSPPPLSQVDSVFAEEIKVTTHNGFDIRESQNGQAMATLISPDMAVCDDCAGELKDSIDRRYLYPFINCTNCGPRYSIIFDIPYDRPNTSMDKFQMCPDCMKEYTDPANRRFHAQPNACETCGPWVEMRDNTGNKLQEKEYAVVFANQSLKRGAILAVKGLGGFHLACDAHNKQAVAELRKRKNREEKPLAVMVKDLETAQQYARLNDHDIALLSSQQAPIVLVKKRKELSPNIAPGNPRIGLMLPYTPLHHLLFSSALDALVMTSGNFSEEPICIDNEDAIQRLGGIAEYFLVHNRDILQRVDDSVTIVLNDTPRLIRRSRGYVPRPVKLLRDSAHILAVGAELKNTLCYTKDDKAFISQHIGDLSNTRAMDFFHHTREHLKTILEIQPDVLAYDLHPGYLATKWALEESERAGLPAIGIQHHHSHLASVMAEHQIQEPVIGLIMDGTGYGTDGKIWGGEVLVGDYTNIDRFAHFEYVPEPGGDKAIREPWRMGLSYLYHTFGDQAEQYISEVWKELPTDQIFQMLEKGINSPETSSCGRLFDGISAIAGGSTHISYEGQSAIEFEHHMRQSDLPSLEYAIEKIGGRYEFKIPPIVKSAIASLEKGATLGDVSYQFHEMLVELFTEVASIAREETGIKKVALSGGVFQNAYLFERLERRLESRGFDVITHSDVPTNDGGISLGQAAVAQAILNANVSGVNYQ